MRQNVRNRRYQRYNALKLYLAKLNQKFEAFFQYTRKNWNVEDNMWYEARPVVVIKKCEAGQNSLFFLKIQLLITN